MVQRDSIPVPITDIYIGVSVIARGSIRGRANTLFGHARTAAENLRPSDPMGMRCGARRSGMQSRPEFRAPRDAEHGVDTLADRRNGVDRQPQLGRDLGTTPPAGKRRRHILLARREMVDLAFADPPTTVGSDKESARQDSRGMAGHAYATSPMRELTEHRQHDSRLRTRDQASRTLAGASAAEFPIAAHRERSPRWRTQVADPGLGPWSPPQLKAPARGPRSELESPDDGAATPPHGSRRDPRDAPRRPMPRTVQKHNQPDAKRRAGCLYIKQQLEAFITCHQMTIPANGNEVVLTDSRPGSLRATCLSTFP